jgi:hypothetical protein
MMAVIANRLGIPEGHPRRSTGVSSRATKNQNRGLAGFMSSYPKMAEPPVGMPPKLLTNHLSRTANRTFEGIEKIVVEMWIFPFVLW